MKLMHIFFDTDMRCSHDGLRAICHKEGLKNIGMGSVVVFINHRQTHIKILAGTDEKDSLGIVASYKSPHGRVDTHAIQFIPESFGGANINYSKALEKSLLERLKQ